MQKLTCRSQLLLTHAVSKFARSQDHCPSCMFASSPVTDRELYSTAVQASMLTQAECCSNAGVLRWLHHGHDPPALAPFHVPVDGWELLLTTVLECERWSLQGCEVLLAALASLFHAAQGCTHHWAGPPTRRCPHSVLRHLDPVLIHCPVS